MSDTKKPPFIVIDGIDGAGKSTQLRLFGEKVLAKAGKVAQVADPGTTPAGLGIRKILLDKEIALSTMEQLLLFTAARSSTATLVRERIAAGVPVVCDRWMLSTLVYQGSLGGIPLVLIKHLHDSFVGIDPDVVLLLDISYEEALRRRAEDYLPDRFESKPVEWQQQLRTAYRAMQLPNMIRVDVSGMNAEETHNKLWELAMTVPAIANFFE